jgi:hypothetical protein
MSLLIIILIISIFPETLLIPILFMELILRLFGKSFSDHPKEEGD